MILEYFALGVALVLVCVGFTVSAIALADLPKVKILKPAPRLILQVIGWAVLAVMPIYVIVGAFQ